MEQVLTLSPHTLSWRAHPARQRPIAAAAAALAIATVALASAAAGGAFWGVLAAVVLVLSLGRFFFPSRFAIDQRGVTATYLLSTQRLAWAEIRRFCCDRHGAYLSTRSRPSRLDAYRGLHLLFGARREEVLTRIRACLGRGERVMDDPQNPEVLETSEVFVRGTLETCPTSGRRRAQGGPT